MFVWIKSYISCNLIHIKAQSRTNCDKPPNCQNPKTNVIQIFRQTTLIYLLAAAVSSMSTKQQKTRESLTALDLITFVFLIRINLYLIHTRKTMQCFIFIFDYSFNYANLHLRNFRYLKEPITHFMINYFC